MYKLLLLALIPLQVFASSNWYCKDVASERADDIIRACGVGEGKDENEARTKAFQNARTEFTNICSNSSDCKNRQVTITPQRTACETEKGKHKCYRLIEFTILDKIDTQKTKLESYSASGMPSTIDKAERFKPFYYEEIAKYPKIAIGMTKKEALENFGKPTDVGREDGQIILAYPCRLVKFCSRLENIAFVYIDEESDQVVRYTNFDFKYTEDLKPREIASEEETEETEEPPRKKNCGLLGGSMFGCK